MPSTEGKNFSLLPLENRPTKKQEPICKTQAEVSQPYPSFVSLFLTHSQNYHLILFYWNFNSRQKCLGFCFLFFFFVLFSLRFPVTSFKSRIGAIIFPPTCQTCGNIAICTWGSVEGLPQMWAATCSISGPSQMLQEDLDGNATRGMLELTSPALNLPSFLSTSCLDLLISWTVSVQVSEVGNKESIVSVFLCENKSPFILAKCHFPQETCWFYEVGLSNRKIDWLADSQIYKAEWENGHCTLAVMHDKQAVYIRVLSPKFHPNKVGFMSWYSSCFWGYFCIWRKTQHSIGVEKSWEGDTKGVCRSKCSGLREKIDQRSFSFIFFFFAGLPSSPTF